VTEVSQVQWDRKVSPAVRDQEVPEETLVRYDLLAAQDQEVLTVQEAMPVRKVSRVSKVFAEISDLREIRAVKVRRVILVLKDQPEIPVRPDRLDHRAISVPKDLEVFRVSPDLLVLPVQWDLRVLLALRVFKA
jgi:hypothetical protein